jgi:signal transduction histidine kinase
LLTLAVGALLCVASSGEAAPPVRQVLLLLSLERGNLTLDSFTTNFRVDLDQRVGRPVNVVQLVVGPTGFVGAPEQATVDYIRATYTSRPKPDLIVALAGPATIFARRNRQQLFPDTPLLFGSVDQRFLEDAPLAANETAVAVHNDYPGLIDTILQLRPGTRQVFMIMGSGLLGQYWHQQFAREFERFRDRLTFIWSDELSFGEILRRSATLPPDAAIFYFTFGTDAAGAAYADERVLADLHAAASVPIFGAQSAYLGYGIVGGTLMPIDELSRTTADVAIRLLNGVPPGIIRLPPKGPGQPVFDWRELQRWGISESRLPAGSVVQYRPPSLWDEYRFAASVSLAALLVQFLLILGLLYQRRARRRAETESRRNLALAADASRRETMSALTSSIAHELGQPLSAIMYNAQALQLMVSGGGVAPETLEEILSDIESQGVHATEIIDRHRTMLRSRQLNKVPLDLHTVINESLALVSHGMITRQVETTVHLCSSPCGVIGDPVLLQQVLVNLVVNAMDAMDEMPQARRHVTIQTDVRGADVDVSVRDTGRGLPAQVEDTLFSPFVTTKAHGLGIGLTIARTIVDAHGGTITARNNPDGGATFTITLHRSDAANLLPGPQAAA